MFDSLSVDGVEFAADCCEFFIRHVVERHRAVGYAGESPQVYAEVSSWSCRGDCFRDVEVVSFVEFLRNLDPLFSFFCPL